jgi:hypothetical protein
VVFAVSLAGLLRLDPLESLWARIALAALALLSLTALAAGLVHKCLERGSIPAAKATLLGYGLFSTLLIGEIFFSFIPRSNGNGNALAMRRWMAEYWKPINRFGFRDPDYSASDLERKRKILVVGDSFVAGHGIKDYRKRFPDLLQAMLPEGCLVVTIAAPGWDSRQELDELERFPYQPDLVVLGYVGNDIAGAAGSLGKLPRVPQYGGLEGPLQTVVRHSYFLDFVYWLLPRRDAGWYARALKSLYDDPAVLGAHEADLGKLIEQCRKSQAKLVVVIFPFLEDVAASGFFTRPIDRFFRDHAVPVIEVSTLLDDHPAKDLIINSSDAHPSELVHRLVADALYQFVARGGPCRKPSSLH